MEHEPSNRHAPGEPAAETSGERTPERDGPGYEREPRLVVSHEELHARAPLKMGHVIDRKYKVRGVLGCGGQSWVFLVSHVFLDTQYALKLFHRDEGITQEMFLRGLQEAKAQCQITHPNIAKVEDAGVTPSGQFYLVVELMLGQSLRSVVLDHGSLELHEVLEVGEQIAEGMEAVHARDIIHRDLKPENLFINAGSAKDAAHPYNVKIIDFGIAKIAKKPEIVTEKDMVLGTVQYMSPEQFQARTLTHLSDIYSFGVILYELILGERLVEYFVRRKGLNRDLHSMGTVILSMPIPLLHELPGLQDKVTPEFSALVNRCLAKKEAQRFESMHQVAQALRHCRTQTGSRPAMRELWRPRPTAGSGVVKTDRPTGAPSPQHAPQASSEATTPAASANSVVSPDAPTAPAPPSPVVPAREVALAAVTAPLGSPARTPAAAQRALSATAAPSGVPREEPQRNASRVVPQQKEPPRDAGGDRVGAQVEGHAPRPPQARQRVAPAQHEPPVVVQLAPARSLQPTRPELPRNHGQMQRAQRRSVLRVFAAGGALGTIAFGAAAIVLFPPAQLDSARSAAPRDSALLVPPAPAPPEPAATPEPAASREAIAPPVEADPSVAGPAAALDPQAPPVARRSATRPRAARPSTTASSTATVSKKDVDSVLTRILRVEAEMERERKRQKPLLPRSGIEEPLAPPRD